MTWSGDLAGERQGQAEGIDLRYTIPDEGAPLWFDLFVLPADAERPEAAHRFVEHLLRPEAIARATNDVWYPNPNAEVAPHVAPELLADPAVYPPEEAMGRLFAVRSRPAAEKAALARTWRRLKFGL